MTPTVVLPGGGQELLGVAAAVGSALLYDAGWILEKQALATIAPLRPRPVELARTLASSKRWLAGFTTMLAALGLQVVALTLAPVSVVQPVLAAGLIALAAGAGPILGERLTRRQVACLVLLLGAVIAVAVSARAGERVAAVTHWRAFLELGLPLCLLAVLTARAGLKGAFLPVATGAGLFYGLAAVAEKAVATQLVAHGMIEGLVSSLRTPYPWLLAVATVAGLVVFQVGLQRHPASLMATYTNVVSGICALVGAAAVFGEELLPAGWWTFARLLAFSALLGAVAVLGLERQRVPATA